MSYSRTTWVAEETALSAANMNNIEDGIEEALAITSNLIDLVYPVGSIYMSVSSTNPGTVFGVGTWEAWGSGRVPVGVNTSDTNFSTVEKTGGASTVTLTTDQMPSHTHTQNQHRHAAPTLTNGDMRFVVADAQASVVNDVVNNMSGDSYRIPRQSANYNGFYDAGNTAYTTATNENAGGGQAHSNLQPYITCYMFKRVS